MPLDDDPLRWWEDRQVEVNFPDGRTCRSWVLQCSSWPAFVAGEEPPVERPGVGRMTIIPFPEPGDLPYPEKLTVPVDAAAEHGRPRGVRLLRYDEELNAGRRRRLRSETRK